MCMENLKQLERLRGEVYWLRVFIGWLKLNLIRRIIFKKQINSFSKSLQEREIKLNKIINQ